MIREIQDDDYELIKSWWSKHPVEVEVLPKEILPQGFIAYSDDMPVFATWVYTSSCGTIGWVAWTVVNPDADYKKRESCFRYLMEFAEGFLKSKGVKVLFAGVNNASLLARLQDSGFSVYDRENVHLAKVL